MKIIFDRKNDQAYALEKDKIIGTCKFIEEKNIWNIIHTEVDRAYQGQKIAKLLVLEVKKKAKTEKKQIVEDCSYAKKILEQPER